MLSDNSQFRRHIHSYQQSPSMPNIIPSSVQSRLSVQPQLPTSIPVPDKGQKYYDLFKYNYKYINEIPYIEINEIPNSNPVKYEYTYLTSITFLTFIINYLLNHLSIMEIITLKKH